MCGLPFDEAGATWNPGRRAIVADEPTFCRAAFFCPLGVGIGIAIEFLTGCFDTDSDSGTDRDSHDTSF